MVDKKDAFAILLIFAICMGLGNMQERSTLPEFLEGISVREAIEGKASPLHSQIAAQFTLIFSAITNFPPTSAQTISQSLLFLSPLILALSSCFLFLSLRFLGFARAVSAFATLVFCIPLCAQQFLPGYYSSTHLALLPFSISVALLSKHSQKAIAGAAIFASISGYLSPAFGIGFAAAAFSFAISSKKEALPLAAICAISLASAFLSPDFPHLSFTLPNLQSFFKQFPALVSIGLGGSLLYFLGISSLPYFALAVFSIALSSFTPLPAGLLLSLSAAEGATAVLRQEISKQAKLLASFAIGFLAIFSMAFNIANLYQAGALALMAGVLSALLMYFYEYSNKQVFSAIFIFLFASTLFLAILRMNSLGNSLYLDPSLSKALSSQEAKQSEKVYMIGFHDAAKFYLPSSKIGNQSELLQYIYFGKGKLESGSAVLISLQQVFFSDSYPSSASFVPLQYAGRMPSGGREFAIFTSPQGIAIARELDAKGEFALSDGILLDSSGRQYGSVPISRMVLLRQAPYENNLLIWISEGDSLPFMLKIYANQTDLIYVQDFGNVSLFKVK